MNKKIVIAVIIGLLVVSLAAADTVFLSENEESLYFGLGNHYVKEGNLEKGISFFDKVIELNPNNAAAYHNKGVALYQQGNTEAAIGSILKAIEYDGSYSQAQYSLGLLYFKLGDYDNAILYLEGAATIEPENTNVLFDTAVAYVERFRSNEPAITEEHLNDLYHGLEYYKEVLSHDVNFPHAKDNAEIVGAVIADYEEALSHSKES